MRSPYHRSPSSTGPSPIDAHRHCGRYCRQREFARAIHKYNTTTRACPFPSDANQWQPEAMRPPRDGNAKARAKPLYIRATTARKPARKTLCVRATAARKPARKPLYVRATAAPRPALRPLCLNQRSSGRATVRLPRGPAPPARAAVAPAAAPAAHRRRGSSLRA